MSTQKHKYCINLYTGYMDNPAQLCYTTSYCIMNITVTFNTVVLNIISSSYNNSCIKRGNREKIIFFTDHQHLAWLALRLLRLDHRSSADSLMVGFTAVWPHRTALIYTNTSSEAAIFLSSDLLIVDRLLISTQIVFYCNTFSNLQMWRVILLPINIA